MVSNEALNTLLDQLAAFDSREDQLAILRAWVAAIMQAWNDERIGEKRETLGKLGGG
jgi:hypothetical protein